MEFNYRDTKFTSPEEVEAYDMELIRKWRASDYKDEKIIKERNDFSEAIGNYILDLLRTLTVDLDESKFNEDAAVDGEYEELEDKRC